VVGGAVGLLVLGGFAYLGRLLFTTTPNQARVIPGGLPPTPPAQKASKDDAASDGTPFSATKSSSATKPPRPTPPSAVSTGVDGDSVFDLSEAVQDQDSVRRAAAALASTVRASLSRPGSATPSDADRRWGSYLVEKQGASNSRPSSAASAVPGAVDTNDAIMGLAEAMGRTSRPTSATTRPGSATTRPGSALRRGAGSSNASRPMSATTARPGSSSFFPRGDRPSSAVNAASGMMAGMLSPRTAAPETLDLDDLNALDEDVLEDDDSSVEGGIDEEHPFSL